MIAHLRADLIRLRHRPDVWIVGIAVLALFSLSYVAGYQGLVQSEAQMRAQIVAEKEQWAVDNPGQDVPPDMVGFWQARIDETAAQRAGYLFPASVMTVFDGAMTPLAALGYLATMTLGLEFGWATIRTVLLSSPDRVRLLASRLLVLAGYGIALVAALLLLSAVLPFALPLLGPAPPGPGVVEPVMVVGRLGAVGVAMVFVLGLMALLAILTRNPAMPILLVLLLFLVEGVVGNLSIWQSAHLELVARSSPLNSVIALLTGAAEPFAYGIGAPPDPTSVVRPLWLSFAVVAGWAAVFIGLATAYLRKADINE